jgi:hypothetical protein
MNREFSLRQSPVIPTGVKRSEAKWRDLFFCIRRHD